MTNNILPIIVKSGTDTVLKSTENSTLLSQNSGFAYVDKPFYKGTGVYKVKMKIVSVNNNYNLIGFTGSTTQIGYVNTGDNIHLYGEGTTRHVSATTYSQSATAFTYGTGDTLYIKIDTDNTMVSISKNDKDYVNWSKNLDLLGNKDFYYIFFGGNTSSFEYEIYHEYHFRFPINKILLLSDNKTYSLESINTVHETKMTSNTAPSPLVASASSNYSTSYPAWMAFNGTANSSTDAWVSATGVTDAYVTLDFGVNKAVNKLTLIGVNNTSTMAFSPKNYEVYGSYDNNKWHFLTGYYDVNNWTTKEERTYKFTNNKKYRYYKVRFFGAQSTNYVAIGQIIFGYNETNILELSSRSQDSFINYGARNIKSFNHIFTNKNYILQDTVSEDIDGIWKTKLNRKPLSIKFD